MKDYSQNGESMILQSILPEYGFFVELGAGDGYYLSNARYFKDKGWNGLMVDADSRGNADVYLSFITRENILDIFNLNNVPNEIDLLSIDLDGNDYWILKEILSKYKPKVICFEINSQLPLNRSIVMPYKNDHIWDGTYGYGMSYSAGFKLCEEFGYKVYDIVNGANIIAVKDHNIIPKDYVIKETWAHPEKEINWQEI